MNSSGHLELCHGVVGPWISRAGKRLAIHGFSRERKSWLNLKAFNGKSEGQKDVPQASNSRSSLQKDGQDKSGSRLPDRLLDSLDVIPQPTRRQLQQQYTELKHLSFYRGIAARARLQQQQVNRAVKEWQGRVLYSYFNWREDTWSDVQLLLWLNGVILLLGAAIQVMVVVLGQDLPDVTSGLPGQFFAVAAAVVGLASFALVLALIEQVVLEVLDSNVRRGSRVYEKGHMVVLTWCDSARDLSMVKKLLSQICQANRGQGGGTAVVLAQDREKLEMESIFKEAIPPSARYGTQFVFRQGSPLDPGALHMVGVTKARAVIVCGDHARSAQESDAQCLRAAILLDELAEEDSKLAHLTDSSSPGPRVVVHARSPDAEKALRFSCSQRVFPMPTAISIAKRITRIVRHPVIAAYSHMFTDFSSTAHGVVNYYPELEGLPFRELHRRFPNATVLGILNESSGRCILNPDPELMLEHGDEVMLLRPGPFEPESFPPLEHPPAVSMGHWDRSQYSLQINASNSAEESRARNFPVQSPSKSSGNGVAVNGAPIVNNKNKNKDQSKNNGAIKTEFPIPDNSSLYTLPLQYSSTLLEPTDVLVCGWSSECLMWAFLSELDHGTQPLPRGARVTLLNQHSHVAEQLGALCEEHNLTSLEVTHVQADPRIRYSLSNAVNISQYQAAVVLCDHSWSEGAVHGMKEHRSISQSEMLRLDSEVLQVQINIRLLLQERGCPNINIICERTSYTGRTRFEDPTHLPLSIILNSASYSAKLLAQAAYEPRLMRPYSQLGRGSDIVVQDISAIAKEGERLSYLQLQARLASVHQVLMGYYRLPSAPGYPLEIVVNPQGLEARMEPVVWNQGDLRCKLVTMATSETIQQASMDASRSSSSSDGSWEVDSSLQLPTPRSSFAEKAGG